MSDLAVTLTIEQLEALLRRVVREELRAEEPQPGKPISDDEMAEARRRWARKAAMR